MRTGIASFTLDYGRCPRWLFERMVRLGRVVGSAIIEEFGTEEFLKRLSDPVWFQSLGTVMAFDWNASGLTTTTLGALKVAFYGLEKDYGFYICGGKGKTSRKTPQEIENWGGGKDFVDTSRLTAKVDTCLIQDSFQIYHHNFIFDNTDHWTVIQQGMNPKLQRARRYHWFGGKSEKKDENLIEEPHSGIITQMKLPEVLDLTSKRSKENRKVVLELVHEDKTLFRDLKILTQRYNPQRTFKILDLPNREFSSHPVEKEYTLGEKYPISDSPRIKKSLQKIIFAEPDRFVELLLTPGAGPKTIRALSLVAEIIYGAKPSYEDPARYSFAHGGKDGTPYPVDRETYDKTLAVMEKALLKANLYYKEKDSALRRMERSFI